tara:strand:+ start:4579 stop:4803 length:225 start_codon:yes stop_codon:yes gene_type:complete
MAGSQHNDPKRTELIEFCIRYVAFFMFVCLAAFFLLGWSALLTWAGLAWGMWHFCKNMLGDPPADQSDRHDCHK